MLYFVIFWVILDFLKILGKFWNLKLMKFKHYRLFFLRENSILENTDSDTLLKKWMNDEMHYDPVKK